TRSWPALGRSRGTTSERWSTTMRVLATRSGPRLPARRPTSSGSNCRRGSPTPEQRRRPSSGPRHRPGPGPAANLRRSERVRVQRSQGPLPTRQERMPLVDAFLSDILESPDDDTSRLIYADWLDDHGQPERAEFIRVQIELARLPYRDRRRLSLEQRERA